MAIDFFCSHAFRAYQSCTASLDAQYIDLPLSIAKKNFYWVQPFRCSSNPFCFSTIAHSHAVAFAHFHGNSFSNSFNYRSCAIHFYALRYRLLSYREANYFPPFFRVFVHTSKFHSFLLFSKSFVRLIGFY